MLALVSVGVGAIQYSNVLNPTSELVSIYPLELAWSSAGPFTGDAFANIGYFDDIALTNLNTETSYSNVRVFFELTPPAGAVNTMWLLEVAGVELVLVDQLDGTFSAEHPIVGAITPSETIFVEFRFTYLDTALLGSYNWLIFANKP